MLKKTAANQDEQLEAPAREQFAADVIKLYTAALAGQLAGCADSSIEIRRVGFGLVALRQALDPFLHKFRNDPVRMAAAGGFEALAILDALTSGRDHPIWKHVDGLRSGRYRPGAAAAVEQERHRRAMLVGVVLAYQEKTGVSQRAAVQAVVDGIKSPDFPLTFEQLRGWVKRNDGKTHAKRFLIDSAYVDDCPDDGERIMVVGREALHALLVVPAIPLD
jgi:hypothetical protein